MMIPTNAFEWLTLHGLVTAVAVLIYVVHSHVMPQRRQPSAAIAWMLFILLVPYLALPAYLVFGSRKLARPAAAQRGARPAPPAQGHWAADTLIALNHPAPAAFAHLAVHPDGAAARDSLLALIDSAERSIDVCTFIFAGDAMGQAVMARLVARAQAGVRVRLMIDGMGSLMTRPPSLKPLKAAGGECAIFVPPLRSPLKGRTNLRNHRKLVLVDAALPSARLWSGGRNLASEYFTGASGSPAWRDLSFALSGPLTQQAAELFERDWRFAQGQPPLREAAPPSAAPSPTSGAQLLASGPDQSDDTFYALLLTAAYRAQQRIALATPYFVPDSALQMALCMAARRGVQVDLLLPARSNHRLSDLARGRALRALHQAGARLWLTGGMLHAKLVLFDGELALAGSANLDSRSLFINYEMMFAFHGVPNTAPFEAWFDNERANASPHHPTNPGLLRDTAEGLVLWTGFQL